MSSNDLDLIEQLEDKDPEHKNRPVLLIPGIIVVLLLCAAAGAYAYTGPLKATFQPTQEPTEEITQEPTELVELLPVPVATEEAIDLPTGEPTEQPTPVTSSEPPERPTDEPTRESTEEVILATEEPTTPAPVCGDLVCDAITENTDVCADCQCIDNGMVDPGEGCNCRDVVCQGEELVSSCGSPCSVSGLCGSGLACSGGVCWDAFICQGIVPEDPTATPKVVYTCWGPYLEYPCSIDGVCYNWFDACVAQECTCSGTELLCSNEGIYWNSPYCGGTGTNEPPA